MNKAYIDGKITGLKNYKEKFMSENEKEFKNMAKNIGGVEINISAENHSSVNVFEMAKEADDAIVARLNEIDNKKCRFGANVEELENEQKELINTLKNRGYEIEIVDIN